MFFSAPTDSQVFLLLLYNNGFTDLFVIKKREISKRI